MIKFPYNVLTFAAGHENVYERFVDYWRHFQAQDKSNNWKVKRAYEERNSKGELISFAEKEEQMNAALKAEIARISGVNFDPSISVEQWAMNPMVKWATFAIVDGMIDMILPDALIDDIGLYSTVDNISWGDSAAYHIKPRDLFLVSQSGRAQKSSEVHKQFETTVTAVPVPHQITVQVALYKVLAGKHTCPLQ